MTLPPYVVHCLLQCLRASVERCHPGWTVYEVLHCGHTLTGLRYTDLQPTSPAVPGPPGLLLSAIAIQSIFNVATAAAKYPSSKWTISTH